MGSVQEVGVSKIREAERLDRLQAELEGVVAKDSRYWLQNDAKFRAVAQVRNLFNLLFVLPVFLSRVLHMSSLKSLWQHPTSPPWGKKTLWAEKQRERVFGIRWQWHNRQNKL